MGEFIKGLWTDERKFKLAARGALVFAGMALTQPQTIALFELPDAARQLGPLLAAAAAMMPSGPKANGTPPQT